MSLKIGQFRKEQLNVDDYKEFITSEVLSITYTRSRMLGYLDVIDNGFELPEGIVFSKGVTYCVKLSLNCEYAGDTTFMLVQELKDSKTYMPIKRINVLGPGQPTEVILMFTPNEDYKYLVFCRNEYLNSDVLCFIETIEVLKLKNLIDTYFSLSYPNCNYLKNIGIQGSQGLRFALNGEGFTLNSTRMFLLNDVNISQLSFLIDEESSSFLVDFQY